MIGHLRGRLAAKHPPQLVVDVGGVGYELEAPMSTFYTLPAVGAEVSLHTHLVVREDAHVLFGFGTERERSLFRELIKVSGVGPRIALAILSGVTVDELVAANSLPSENLQVGQQLVIPGYEGLTGFLNTEVVGFGDSLRGLARRNQVDIPLLQRLNRIISPSELYVGVSLIVPQQDGVTKLTASAAPALGATGMGLSRREQSRPPVTPGRGSPRGPALQTSHKPVNPSPSIICIRRTILKNNLRFS